MSDVGAQRTLTVDQLEPREWRVLRELLLAALEDSPDSFGSTAEQEKRNSEHEWRSKFDTCTWFVARATGEAMGLVGATDSWDNSPGEADLVSMWIAPNHRGLHVAPMLIDAARSWALANGVDTLALWVIDGQDRAKRVYEKCGFVPTYASALQRDPSQMAQKFELPLL